ncbi:tRNA methyltransferase 10 C [Bulinus truncatus]|nr:tRNA methyltransferase 10 C [Bulinus truncatus]
MLVRAASSQSDLRMDFTKDLNIDELREEIRKKKKFQKVYAISLIKETIAQKCDEAIANLSEEEKKKLKIIQLEHSFLYSEGQFIPSGEEMTSEYWLEAMKLTSKAQRLKYYTFIMKRNQTKLNAKMKAKEKGEEKEVSDYPMHSYEHGRLFMRIYESTMKKYQNYKLASSMQFGLPLVLDMDYMDYMRPQEVRNTVSQLLKLYTMNRADEKDPFHLHFTSCPESHPMHRMLQIELQDNEHFLSTVTEKSYLDVFDNQQLVYLSPDARQVMKHFDPEAVYIIGAFNDKATHQPVSYARAKKQGIKAMRLPLDQYVTWNLGSKNITLNQIMSILTLVKNGVSWEDALKLSLPKRKLRV